MEFVINYGNGFVENVECADLDAAKEEAVAGMSYTQASVQISTAEGTLLATSHWYGVEPGEEDSPLETFGDYGFYDAWIEE